MTHDPCCPLDSAASECPICEAIAAARGEEKTAFNRTWKDNIGSITRRAYERGHAQGAAGLSSDWTRW